MTRRLGRGGQRAGRSSRILAVAGLAYLASHAAAAGARVLPPHLTARWERTNHKGERLTLMEGPVWVAGAGVAVAAAARFAGPRVGLHRRDEGLVALSALTAIGAAAVAGAADDHAPADDPKGLAGHLGALRRGRVTTGTVKIVALGLAGLVSAVLEERGRRPATGAGARRIVDVALGSALVAGTANLANLLDLRPGRALKAGLLAAGPLTLGAGGSSAAAAAIGSSLAVLPDDLAGRSMLGDTGANPLGALIGVAVLTRTGTCARAATVGALLALTLASERVSFTAVIEGNPLLRSIDQWGRRVP